MKKAALILLCILMLAVAAISANAEIYPSNVTITTPYLEITFDLNRGGRIVELSSDITGSSNYGENLVAQGDHKEISDGLYWTGSVNGWFTQLYGDQTESVVQKYEVLENSSSKIRIHLSTITSYLTPLGLVNDTRWDWVVIIPKDKSEFYINHTMEIISPDFSGYGIFYFRTVPELNNNPVFSYEYDWTDLSGITPNFDGFSILMEGMAGVEWTQPQWGSQQEILWPYNNPHISLSQGVKYTGFSTILLHGDYASDGDASNDWKYVAKRYGFLCGDNVCDSKEACETCSADCGYCPDSITFDYWNPSNNSVSAGNQIEVYVNASNKINLNDTENIQMSINDVPVPYNVYETGEVYIVRYDSSDPDEQYAFVNGSNYKIEVFVKDKGNFTANTNWQFVYADQMPPVITILSPIENMNITQPFFWVNVTTNENANCVYNLTDCQDEAWWWCGKLPTTPFTYNDKLHHAEMFDISAYQEKNTYQKYALNISCYDEFNNVGKSGLFFDVFLANSPPYWLQEPQDQILEQGSSLLYDVNASDDDEDALTYTINSADIETEGLTFIDSDYTNSYYEEAIWPEVSDTLREGETKTYTINSKDYEITAVIINADNQTAIFSVNGVLTTTLHEGEIYIMQGSFGIGVNEILTNQREQIAEFSLVDYATDDVMLVIKGIKDSDTQFRLLYMKYKVPANEDIYVPAGKDLKEFLPRPEFLLTDNWDIVYAGLMNIGVSKIKLAAVSNHSYNLEFENINGEHYIIPFITNKNDSGRGFKYGDIYNDLIFKEAFSVGSPSFYSVFRTFISINDSFLVSNNASPSGEAVINALKYLSINTNERTLQFKDFNDNDVAVTYSGIPGINASGELIVSGASHKLWVGNASRNYSLSIDLDGNGNLSEAEIKVVVKGGGVLDLGDQIFDIYSGGLHPVITQSTLVLTTPSSYFDEHSDGPETTNITITPLPRSLLSAIVDRALYEDENDNRYSRGMSKYGVLVEKFTPADNSSIPEVTIDYPLSQRGAQVFITAESSPNTGDSAEFKTGSDIISIGERIGSVKQTFTALDLDALKSGVFNTGINSTPVKQYLKFDNTTASVIYTTNDNGEAGDFLKFPANSTLFEYHLEFTEGASSYINLESEEELIDLDGQIISILGRDFKIEEAWIGPGNEIALVLVPYKQLNSSWIMINPETGLITFTPPADWYGDLSFEVKASDGLDETSKIITFTVTQKQTTPNELAPSRSGGGGGGGGGAITNESWNCSSEWSSCINGKQTQACTQGKATKTNTRACETTIKPAETSATTEGSEQEQKEDLSKTPLETSSQEKENLSAGTEAQEITGAFIGTSQQRPVWLFVAITLALVAAVTILFIKTRKRV